MGPSGQGGGERLSQRGERERPNVAVEPQQRRLLQRQCLAFRSQTTDLVCEAEIASAHVGRDRLVAAEPTFSCQFAVQFLHPLPRLGVNGCSRLDANGEVLEQDVAANQTSQPQTLL